MAAGIIVSAVALWFALRAGRPVQETAAPSGASVVDETATNLAAATATLPVAHSDDTSRTPAAMPTQLPEHRPIQIRVRDLRGRPLAAVRVESQRDGSKNHLGVTNTAGILDVEDAPATEFSVMGSYRRRWKGEAVVVPGQREVDLVIDTGGLISGVVITDRGSPPPDPTLVLAWSDDTPLSPMDLARAAMSGDPDALVTRTDASGFFEIDGLDRARAYQLVAGGAGWTHEKPLKGVLPDGADIQFELTRIFPLVVEFVDQISSGPVKVSRAWLPWGAIRPRVENSDTRQFAIGPGALLAGLPDELCNNTDVSRRAVFVLTTRPDLDVAGPIRLKAAVPGYEPVEVQLSAAPLERGVTIERVEFAPLATAWGNLTVTIQSEEDASGARWIGPEEATCVRLQGANDLDLRYGVVVAPGASIELADVPVGVYSASLEVNWGAHSIAPTSPGPISIDAATNRLDFDLSGTGGIEIAAVRRSGQPCDMAATVALAAPGRSFGLPLVFTEGPHVLRGLAPGEYRVRLLSPFVTDMNGTAVRVTAGKISRLEIKQK